MQGILVFAGFMVLWKAMDIGIQAYQLYLQAILQAFEIEKESESSEGAKGSQNEENGAKTIGFQNCSGNLQYIEED